ncbi:hypothetical protein [Marinomonas sp.]
MDFEQYKQCLENFSEGRFESIQTSYDEICQAQDKLIEVLVEQGASIKGWKVVEDDELFIISPIFDFQIFASHGAKLPEEKLTGIEVEICYQSYVPVNSMGIEPLLDKAEPLVAAEIMRPKINSDSYQSCDFYYNYGIVVSHIPLAGEQFFLESGSGKVFEYSTAEDGFFDTKLAILRKGIEECIRRGYGQEEYFFMTGSLNGLISLDEASGVNRLVHQANTMFEFALEN